MLKMLKRLPEEGRTKTGILLLKGTNIGRLRGLKLGYA